MTKQELCEYLCVTTQHLDSLSRSKQGLDRLNQVLNALVSEVGETIASGKIAHSFFSRRWVSVPNQFLNGAQPLTILVKSLTSEQKQLLEKERSAYEAERTRLMSERQQQPAEPSSGKVIAVEFGGQPVDEEDDLHVEIRPRELAYLTQLSLERGVSVEQVLEDILLERRRLDYRGALECQLADLLEQHPEETTRFIRTLVEKVN
jgi:hypothetical protein